MIFFKKNRTLDMSHRERNTLIVVLVVFVAMLLSGVLLLALQRAGQTGEYLVTSAVAFATGVGVMLVAERGGKSGG